MESIQSIGTAAWACCHKLRDAPVMPNLTSIGNLAFYSCEAMMSMPDLSKVTHIGDYAFSHCSSLPRVVIRGKTSIGKGAFWACENIKEVQAPDSFYQDPYVNKLAFVSCEKLANFEQLTNNNFIVNVQWKNEDLLEKKKESWFSWVYMVITLKTQYKFHDFKHVTFEHDIGEQPMIIFNDSMVQIKEIPSVEYYYGSDVPERNTWYMQRCVTSDRSSNETGRKHARFRFRTNSPPP